MRWLSVFCCDHRVEVELAGPLAGERGADDARGVAQEERDGLGRGELGRHDEVALVLAVLVVDDDDDLAAPDGGDGVLDLRRGGMVLPILPGEEAFDVLGGDVDLEVDAVAGLAAAERGDRRGVRDDGDGEVVVDAASTTVRLTPSTVIEPFSTT